MRTCPWRTSWRSSSASIHAWSRPARRRGPRDSGAKRVRPSRSDGARLMDDRSIVRGIVAQARPILIGQVAGMAFAVIDTVLSGRASPVDLATMGLGLSIYASVFVGLMGAT